MREVKKIAVLVLSILVILASAKFTLAAQIPSSPSNNSEGNSASNSANESGNNAASNDTNSVNSIGTQNNTITNRAPINTTNATENLPSTGVEDTYLNFALIILLAVILGMFSIIQYRKIIKNEEE